MRGFINILSNANDMRVNQDLNSFGEIIAHVQLMNKMLDATKNIFRVYHIRIIALKKNGSHNMKQTDSSIIIVRNVCVLTSASMERVQILVHAHIICI
jgi:hypothetical protein